MINMLQQELERRITELQSLTLERNSLREEQQVRQCRYALDPTLSTHL